MHYRAKVFDPETGRTSVRREEGDNRAAVRERLLTSGLKVINIDEHRKTSSGGRTLPVRTLYEFYQCLSFISESTPVDVSLRVTAQRTPDKAFASLLKAAATAMDRGATLADALAAQGGAFPRIHIAILDAGSRALDLKGALDNLASLCDNEITNRNEVKDSLRGVAWICVFGLICVGVLTWWFVPQMSKLLTAAHVSVPLITQVVMTIGGFVTSWPFIIALCTAVLVGRYVWSQLMKDEAFVLRYERILLRVPVVKRLIVLDESSRFGRIFGSVIQAFPLAAALRLVIPTAGLVTYRLALEQVILDLDLGKPLDVALGRTGLYDPILVQYVAAGSKAAQDENSKVPPLTIACIKAADFLSRDLGRWLKNLIAAVAPIVVSGISGFFTFIALVFYLPYLSLLSELAGR